MDGRYGPGYDASHRECFEFLESRGHFSPGTGLELRIRYSLPLSVSPIPDIYIHWGQRSGTSVWTDEEVAPSEIAPIEGSVFEIRKILHPEVPGEARAAANAVLPGENRKVWQGDDSLADITVSVNSTEVHPLPKAVRKSFSRQKTL